MNEHDICYLKRLRALCDTIDDEYRKSVFYAVCKRFMDYKKGIATTKNISKQDLIEMLIADGKMAYCFNKESGRYDKLPDDRGLRKAMRELLKNGYPILTTSHEDGCFIAESEEEVTKPQKENHSRAVAILAVDKGYNGVKEFIKGGIQNGTTSHVR